MTAYKPILFSTPLVQAILDGRKTETRRILRGKADPEFEWAGWPCGRAPAGHPERRCSAPPEGWHHLHEADGFHWVDRRCPYGVPGDVLWVRETWQIVSESTHYPTDRKVLYVGYKAGARSGCGASLTLPADADADAARWWQKRSHSWRPSIHMPRWACRLWLRVTEVRVERLQAITEAGARAEGVPPAWLDTNGADVNWAGKPTYRQGFARLWDGIAKPGNRWADDPWVWVVAFERIDRPAGWPEVTP